MADNDAELTQDLNFNALLMLSFFGRGRELSPEEKEYYSSMMSHQDASSASVFLLSVVMDCYAMETGRTKEELVEHLQGILLKMADIDSAD